MALSPQVCVIWTALWVWLVAVSSEATEGGRPGGSPLNRLARLPSVASIPLARSSDLLPLFPPLGTPPPVATEEIIEFRSSPHDLTRKLGKAFEFDDAASAGFSGRQLNNGIAVHLSSGRENSGSGVKLGAPSVTGVNVDEVSPFPASSEGKLGSDRPFRPSLRVLGSFDNTSVAEDGKLPIPTIESPRRRSRVQEASRRRAQKRHRFSSKKSSLASARPLLSRPALSGGSRRRASRLESHFRPSRRMEESTFRPSGPRGLSPVRSAPLLLST